MYSLQCLNQEMLYFLVEIQEARLLKKQVLIALLFCKTLPLTQPLLFILVLTDFCYTLNLDTKNWTRRNVDLPYANAMVSRADHSGTSILCILTYILMY